MTREWNSRFVFLLRDGSHGGKLGLGALLGANVNSAALLLGGQLSALLLEHDLADGLALNSQLLALQLQDLQISKARRRLHHDGGG